MARRLVPSVRDDGWFFDTELLVLAQRQGLRIHEVPVDWVDDADSRACVGLGFEAKMAAALMVVRGIAAAYLSYYVSLLARSRRCWSVREPRRMLEGGALVRVLGPLAIVAGVVVEIVVLGDDPDRLGWLPAVLVVGGLAASAGLVASLGARPDRRRRRCDGAAVARSGDLGGPDPRPRDERDLPGRRPGLSRDGRPGRRDEPSLRRTGARGRRRGSGRRRRGGSRRGRRSTGHAGRRDGDGPDGRRRGRGHVRRRLPGDPAGRRLRQGHGGGTVAVSSQNGAAGQLLSSGADLAAIGGFSGRESQVSVAWLAHAVDAGRTRWVLTDGASGGMRQDDRIGSTEVMSAVAATCKAVPSVDGLYDCAGSTAALRAAG